MPFWTPQFTALAVQIEGMDAGQTCTHAGPHPQEGLDTLHCLGPCLQVGQPYSWAHLTFEKHFSKHHTMPNGLLDG